MHFLKQGGFILSVPAFDAYALIRRYHSSIMQHVLYIYSVKMASTLVRPLIQYKETLDGGTCLNILYQFWY